MKTTKMLLYTIIETAIICKYMYNSPLRKQSYFIYLSWLNVNAITSIFFPILSLQISILFLVYQMKKIGLLCFKEDRPKWGILFVFSHKILQNKLFYAYFSLGGKGNDLLLCKIDMK